MHEAEMKLGVADVRSFQGLVGSLMEDTEGEDRVGPFRRRQKNCME